MELSKKTTILFPPQLHERLVRLANSRGTSLGQLVREACEAQYGLVPEAERVEAVLELSHMKLPVGSPQAMEREAQPGPDDLVPRSA